MAQTVAAYGCAGLLSPGKNRIETTYVKSLLGIACETANRREDPRFHNGSVQDHNELIAITFYVVVPLARIESNLQVNDMQFQWVQLSGSFLSLASRADLTDEVLTLVEWRLVRSLKSS
eukprot:3275523-Amphidinium_carterae.1